MNEAVVAAKELLRENKIECNVSSEDLVKWFQADTPYPDIGLDEVLENRLLVIHELVEIDEVKKMGLEIAKDTILSNLERVDEAHLRAASTEIMIAWKLGEYDHIKGRVLDIERWCVDESVTPRQKVEYRKLLAIAKDIVSPK